MLSFSPVAKVTRGALVEFVSRHPLSKLLWSKTAKAGALNWFGRSEAWQFRHPLDWMSVFPVAMRLGSGVVCFGGGARWRRNAASARDSAELSLKFGIGFDA